MRTRDEEFLSAIRQLRCIACGAPPPSDAHHVRSKGAGGGDDWYNIIPLCPDHHTLGGDAWHRLGVRSFLGKFPHVKEYLEKSGWEFFSNKMKHGK